jgi:hypothetical protein
VPETFSLERAYALFRSLGARHLTVVDQHNRVKGVVTRKARHPRLWLGVRTGCFNLVGRAAECRNVNACLASTAASTCAVSAPVTLSCDLGHAHAAVTVLLCSG